MGEISKQELNDSLISEIEAQTPMATFTTAGTIIPLERDFNFGGSTGALQFRQFENSITPTAQGGANVVNTKYFLDRYGICHIHVSATVGFKTIGTVLFTLPVRYRPLDYTVFPVTLANNGINTFSPYCIAITVEGEVVLLADIPADKDVIVGDIMFRTR